MMDDWMNSVKKYGVTEINMSISSNTIFTDIVLGEGDSFEVRKELSDSLFDDIYRDIHNHVTIKDRRKKVLWLKNKMKI